MTQRKLACWGSPTLHSRGWPRPQSLAIHFGMPWRGLEHPSAAAPAVPAHRGHGEQAGRGSLRPQPLPGAGLPHGFLLLPFHFWHGRYKTSAICTQNHFQIGFEIFTSIIPIEKICVFIFHSFTQKTTSVLKLANAKTRWIWKKISEVSSVAFSAKPMKLLLSSVEIVLASLQNLSPANQSSLQYS